MQITETSSRSGRAFDNARRLQAVGSAPRPGRPYLHDTQHAGRQAALRLVAAGEPSGPKMSARARRPSRGGGRRSGAGGRAVAALDDGTHAACHDSVVAEALQVISTRSRRPSTTSPAGRAVPSSGRRGCRRARAGGAPRSCPQELVAQRRRGGSGAGTRQPMHGPARRPHHIVDRRHHVGDADLKSGEAVRGADVEVGHGRSKMTRTRQTVDQSS